MMIPAPEPSPSNSMALERPLPTPDEPPAGLGGLWQGITISADDIDEARRKTWDSLGSVRD